MHLFLVFDDRDAVLLKSVARVNQLRELGMRLFGNWRVYFFILFLLLQCVLN